MSWLCERESSQSKQFGRYWRPMLLVVCLLSALLGFAMSFRIYAKALLAQVLIAISWQNGVTDGIALQPWPWSDHRVIAMLTVPSLNVVRYVVSSDDGAALAFGPGLSRSPASSNSTVVSGHRDTHFAFLADVQLGERIYFQRVDEQRAMAFRVSSIRVVDSRRNTLLTPESGGLLLVTCYPLDAVVPGGPLRLVVTALPESAVDAQQPSHHRLAQLSL